MSGLLRIYVDGGAIRENLRGSVSRAPLLIVDATGRERAAWQLRLLAPSAVLQDLAHERAAVWIETQGEPELLEAHAPAPAARGASLVHVNQHEVRRCLKQGSHAPCITVKAGRRNEYAHRVEIAAGALVVYRPAKPLACGARVWVQCPAPPVLIGAAASPGARRAA